MENETLSKERRMLKNELAALDKVGSFLKSPICKWKMSALEDKSFMHCYIVITL